MLIRPTTSPLTLLVAGAVASLCAANANAALYISEFLPNPNGTDSPFEWVELIATSNINFALTPYSVVFANNGTATSAGWVAGGALTYGFSITTGSVNAGDVVYVGGSSMAPTGTKLRTINTGTTAGDGFGTANSAGVLGNGGTNADAIAVFNAAIGGLNNSTVPMDAIFFGAGFGSAIVSAGAAGYQLPVNDRYSGGKLQTTSFLVPDAASDQVVTASGQYNATTGQIVGARTWAVAGVNTFTDKVSLITPFAPVPEPEAYALVTGGVAVLGLFARRRKTQIARAN